MAENSIGNRQYERRSAIGRPMLFSSPDLLWEEACSYMKDCDDNPVEVKDWVGKDATPVTRMKPLPYTIGGFCIWVGASRHWWNEFRKARIADNDNAFLEVITRIEQIIFEQQYIGAAAGLYQQNIVARALGLVEKSDANVKVDMDARVKNTPGIDYSKLSDGALRELAELANRPGESESGNM
jgi:hypothetical protein